MGATATSDEDVVRLLSVLWAASLRAQAQLGAATSKAPVDTRPELSRTKTPHELDASEELPVVHTAICSKPTPHSLIMRTLANAIWGARCGDLHAGFYLGRREQEAMPTR